MAGTVATLERIKSASNSIKTIAKIASDDLTTIKQGNSHLQFIYIIVLISFRAKKRVKTLEMSFSLGLTAQAAALADRAIQLGMIAKMISSSGRDDSGKMKSAIEVSLHFPSDISSKRPISFLGAL